MELLLLLMIRVEGVLGDAVRFPAPLPLEESTSSRPESKLLEGVTFRWKGFSGRAKVLEGVVGVEGTEVGRAGTSSVGELSSDRRRGMICFGWPFESMKGEKEGC